MNQIMKSAFHGIVIAVLFAVPIVLKMNPEWLNLTVGGVLTAIYHWAAIE